MRLINAAYEHFWTKRWQTSVYGGYLTTSYNSVAGPALCGLETAAFLFGRSGTNCTTITGSTGILVPGPQFNVVDSQTCLSVST